VSDLFAITLYELEVLPARDPRTRFFIRELSERLKPVVEQGVRAHARVSAQELAAVQESYARIRGERGHPENIAEYVARAQSVGQIVEEILLAAKPTLSPKTISRYGRVYSAGTTAQQYQGLQS
jgi:hypothetical protein